MTSKAAYGNTRGEGSKYTRRYHVNRLIFYEHFREVRDAIAREKQLKGWTRAKKEALIRTLNPTYADFAANWYHDACRRPEGPSTLARRLAFAQDDRVENAEPTLEKINSSAQDDRAT